MLPLLLNDRPRGDESSVDRDNDTIVRRISQDHHCVSNGQGGLRVSTLAFEPSSGDLALSVDFEECIVNIPKDPKKFVQTPKYLGAVWLSGTDLRAMDYVYISDPIPGENPCHGLVFGSFTKGRKNALLKRAKWYNQIPGVDLNFH